MSNQRNGQETRTKVVQRGLSDGQLGTVQTMIIVTMVFVFLLQTGFATNVVASITGLFNSPQAEGWFDAIMHLTPQGILLAIFMTLHFAKTR